MSYHIWPFLEDLDARSYEYKRWKYYAGVPVGTQVPKREQIRMFGQENFCGCSILREQKCAYKPENYPWTKEQVTVAKTFNS